MRNQCIVLYAYLTFMAAGKFLYATSNTTPCLVSVSSTASCRCASGMNPESHVCMVLLQGSGSVTHLALRKTDFHPLLMPTSLHTHPTIYASYLTVTLHPNYRNFFLLTVTLCHTSLALDSSFCTLHPMRGPTLDSPDTAGPLTHF